MQSNVGIVWTLGSALGPAGSCVVTGARCTGTMVMTSFGMTSQYTNEQTSAPSSRQLATLNPCFAFLPCAQCYSARLEV